MVNKQSLTCSRMVFLFLASVTADSCMSPIFFIFSSMSIFCSSFRISARSRRTVSSRWCCRATAAAQAEWMAVIQFSSSVWLQVYRKSSRVKGLHTSLLSLLHYWFSISIWTGLCRGHPITWKRNESPSELLRQKTKSFLGCSGTAWTMLFSAHTACLGTLLWSMPDRPSVS